MILSTKFVVALTALGSVAMAAALAVRRNARRLGVEQHQAALEVWDNETGSTGSTGSIMAPADIKLPP